MAEQGLRAYLIAGEPSGDALGALLIAALKRQTAGKLTLHGVGGERMDAAGLKSLFPYQELSLLGFVEILPYVLNISARIQATVDDIVAKQPEVVVTIDVPGFSHRVVKKLREMNYKGTFVHYVAPTVWAYKPERAKLFADLYDEMLVLLPFEPPYFEAEGLPCHFIGHPIVAECTIGNGARFREKHGIAPETQILSLLPGSRKGEVLRHLPIFARAATLIGSRHPNLALSVPVPKHILPHVAPFFEGCPFRAIITANVEERKDALAASNAALVKSGTVTLELAMAKVPMVVAYKVHPLSAWMLRRIIKTPYVSLVNILEQRPIVPEFLQEHCTAETLARALLPLLETPEIRTRQIDDLQHALAKLASPSAETPSELAAAIIMRVAKNTPKTA